MEQILKKANSFPMYLLAVIIVCGVLIQAVLYLKKAWKHGKEIGMDEQVMKQAVQSSVSFTIVPSIGILIGVLALAPSLGIPIPWIRLSVLGALHYESSTANNLAKGLGIGELPSNMMTAGDYASIVLGMSVTILSGLIFTLFFFRKYQNRILNKAKGDPKASDILLSSMFIGMISAFIGYVFCDFSGVFHGDLSGLIPVCVMTVSALVMTALGLASKKKGLRVLADYALPVSLIAGMASAVPFTAWLG